jgi:cell division protein FtsL
LLGRGFGIIATSSTRKIRRFACTITPHANYFPDESKEGMASRPIAGNSIASTRGDVFMMSLRRFLLAALAAAAISPVMAQYQVKEIIMSPEGTFLGLVFSVYAFDVTINDSGIPQQVEMHMIGEAAPEYQFFDDRIDKTARSREAVYFDKERRKIERIGDIKIRYHSADSRRVERIGDTVFTYEAASGKPGRIERIGDQQLRFALPENRVQYVGTLRIEYDTHYRKIERTLREHKRKEELPVLLRIVRTLK